MRVDEVNDADGGADEKAERSGDEHAPEAPPHLELEHHILEDERDVIIGKFLLKLHAQSLFKSGTISVIPLTSMWIMRGRFGMRFQKTASEKSIMSPVSAMR